MLGFVVLTYCSWQETRECVESIIDTYKKPKKIIVVDNASPNNAYAEMQKAFKGDRYAEVSMVKSETNGGFASGNNIGIAECQKYGIKYAVVTNNDVAFNEGTIAKLEEDIIKHKNAVQIAPKILNVENKTMTLPWKRHQSIIQFVGLKSAAEHMYTENELNGLQRVYMVSGCCFIIDIAKFKNMGAFDEGTFLYMEEGTVSMSALKFGYDVMYDADVSIIHKHGASTGRQNLFVDREIIKSGLYYWKKYEKAGNLQLRFIWAVMVLRTVVKILKGTVNKKGFADFVRQTHRKLIHELHTEYDF